MTPTPERPPRVELLVFAGCPNAVAARTLVERVGRELALAPHVEVVEVEDAGAAVRLRFLGSPTIRVDGHDIEPGVERRGGYALSCRLYRTPAGSSGLPAEEWLRAALQGAAS